MQCSAVQRCKAQARGLLVSSLSSSTSFHRVSPAAQSPGQRAGQHHGLPPHTQVNHHLSPTSPPSLSFSSLSSVYPSSSFSPFFPVSVILYLLTSCLPPHPPPDHRSLADSVEQAADISGVRRRLHLEVKHMVHTGRTEDIASGLTPVFA